MALHTTQPEIMPTARLASYSDGPQIREFIKSQACGTIPMLTPSIISNPNDKQRTIIITGANTGLGFDAAKQLIHFGYVSRLILACRSTLKGERAKDRLLPDVQTSIDVQVWELDMARRATIVDFVDRAERELERIDAVVLNAGVELVSYQKAAEADGGYEMTLMVNVVGTMLLAALLVPVLRGKRTGPDAPRISIVGSAVQFFTNYKVLVEAADRENGQGILKWLSDEGRWEGKITRERYLLSKGILQMVVRQLARQVTDSSQSENMGMVVVNSVAPGWCRTELFRESGGFVNTIGLKLIGRASEIGARALLVGAMGVEGGEKSHGEYMSEGVVKKGSSWFETEQGEAIGRRLWEEIVSLVEKAK